MKGLMLKDFYTLTCYKKNLLLMLGIGVLLGFTLDMVTMIPAYLMLVSTSYATGLFSYDETAKFDRFGVTLPVSRKQTVMARYACVMLMLAALAILSIACSALVVFVKGNSTEEILTVLLVAVIMFVMALLVISVLMPICYRFGAEKGRVAIAIALAVVFGSFMLVIYFFSDAFEAIFNLNILLVAGVSSVVALGILVLSLCLSLRFYQKKEF